MQRGFPWASILLGLSCAGATGCVAALALGSHVPGWIPLACLAALIVSIAAGLFVRGAGLFGRPVLGVDPALAGDRLALTFDDGPDPRETRAVMDLLEAHGHRGTFFVIGRRAAGQRALIEEMVARGHGLANHGFAHLRLSAMSPVASLVADLERAQALLESAGVRSRWLRPVAGVVSPRVVDAAQRTGLEIVTWSATARDGIRASIEGAAGRLRRGLRPGAILVLHDGVERGDRRPIAAAVLERLVVDLAARRLRSVTLDELLG